jgi:hypothetical protein
MDVFKIATDDFIKDMCKNIRRPGGTLPNPNAEQPGAPAMIPRNGVASCVVGILCLSPQAHFSALSGSVQCGAYFLDDQDQEA